MEEEKKSAMSIQSLQRFVDPRDIAALAVFLASDAGKSISGATLPIQTTRKRPRELRNNDAAAVVADFFCGTASGESFANHVPRLLVIANGDEGAMT